MSSPIQHHTVESYVPSLSPLVVFFRTGLPDVGEITALGELTNSAEAALQCDIIVSNSWTHLATSISLAPKLLVFHHSMISDEGVSVTEFVNMIVTLGRYMKSGSHKLRIAVCVGKSCSLSFIKELQSTEVIGITPCYADFGNDATIDGITNLLNNSVYWPKDLINEISQIKHPPKRSAFHLTSRQQQVLTLVCSRGLSNKKIAALLKISESTVKIHISAILKEYGVRNRTQLALAANSSLRA